MHAYGSTALCRAGILAARITGRYGPILRRLLDSRFIEETENAGKIYAGV